jgi:hypothetical protein
VVGAVILLPTLKYRRYWSETWFWMTMLALSTLQVPLAILARPRMDELKFGFNLLFATIDIFLVAVVVNWVRPTEEYSAGNNTLLKPAELKSPNSNFGTPPQLSSLFPEEPGKGRARLQLRR